MAPFLELLVNPPGSAVFILCLATLTSFILSLVRLRFTSKEDLEQLKAWNREISAWNTDFKRARRTGDKKLLKRLRKQEKRIKQLQAKVASEQMKTFPMSMGASMGIVILFWLFLTGRFMFIPTIQLFETPFSGGETVAYLPWFGGNWELNLISWYILCSFAAGMLVSRVLGQTGEETE